VLVRMVPDMTDQSRKPEASGPPPGMSARHDLTQEVLAAQGAKLSTTSPEPTSDQAALALSVLNTVADAVRPAEAS